MTDSLSRLTEALASRYAIERELGAGGMATVYLAEDLKHHRKVAVKVLRPELAVILGAERFLKEIEVTANLQHPNILPLFDSGEANGIPFYVMPYITGESLRDKLDRETQLSLEESVSIAEAVASALDYAHRHDVVHRDIKPANILLQEGKPIVADFGIALAVSAAGGRRLTETGLSVGTPEYMSPEQASGMGTIDARSDVYALASVTYEMLLGEPPHTGPTTQAVIAKIMTEEPRRITMTRGTVPPHIEFAVHRGLAKLPADRFASAADFAEAFSNPHTQETWLGSLPALVTSGAAKRWATRVGVLLLAGAAVWGWFRPTPSQRQSTMRFDMPFGTGEAWTRALQPLTISPDGSHFAYVGQGSGDTRLHVRALDELEARVVSGSDGVLEAFFSPDGQSIGFSTVVGLMRVPITGGVPTSIVEVSDPRGASWGANDEVLFGSLGGLWRVPASGGDPERLTELDRERGDLLHSRPQRLPESDAVLFTLTTAGIEAMQVAVLSTASGDITPLFPGINPVYVQPGFIIYGRPDGVMMAVPFDLRRLEVTGASVQVLQGVTVRPSGSMDFSVSNDGSLVYLTGSGTGGSVVLVDRDGNETTIIDAEDQYLNPRFSPDGERLALGVGVPPTRQIWIYEMTDGTLSPLTFEGHNYYPIWNHNGTRMFFSGETSTATDLRWKSADGSGPNGMLLTTGLLNYPAAASPDGRYLIFREQDSTTQSDILLLPLEGTGDPRRLIDLPSRDDAPAISPDGRWLAFSSDLSGEYEVYVTSLPEPGRRIRVSLDGGTEPMWRADGTELFFRRESEMISAAVETNPEFRVLARDVLFESDHGMWPYHSNYDVHPDGQRFVMMKRTSAQGRLVVVLNWFAELERLTASN